MNPFRRFGRTPWTGDQPLPSQDSTTHKNAYIHDSSGTRTHDLSVRAGQDHTQFLHI